MGAPGTAAPLLVPRGRSVCAMNIVVSAQRRPRVSGLIITGRRGARYDEAVELVDEPGIKGLSCHARESFDIAGDSDAAVAAEGPLRWKFSELVHVSRERLIVRNDVMRYIVYEVAAGAHGDLRRPPDQRVADPER